MKPRLEAILFDMGGTLIEFENSPWDVLNQRCAQRGYDFLKKQNLIKIGYEDFVYTLSKEFEKRWTACQKTLQEVDFEKVVFSLFKKLDLNLTDENRKDFMTRYYQPVTDQITLIQGAVEAVRFFREKNLKVGLLSNTIFPKRFHLEELERFGLNRYLDATIFSSEVGFKKPHPQIFTAAIEILGISADFVAFVGDKLEDDIGGAQKIGMRTILKLKERENYSLPIFPDATINNLTELPVAVLKLFDF